MKKNKFRRRLPGILITALLALAMLLFLWGISQTKLFPAKYLLLTGGVFLLLTLLVGLLTRDTWKTGSLVTGVIVALMILGVMAVGYFYLKDAVDTLADLTQVKVEIADVGVYVRQDDPAEDLPDAMAYQFGILETLDRENTDTVLEQLQQEQGVTLAVTAFGGLEELVDALVNQRSVDAIVINSAYLELLGDMEGHEQTESQLRQLHARQVETLLQTTVPTEEKPLPEQPLPEEEDLTDECFAVYISGIDSRTGLIAKSRSDVNILAVVNPETRQVLLLSTPRDYYVPLPISDGMPDKLTHAGIYGVDVSIGTLEMLYGMDIDYYFRVNFSGFEQIIDALGGITVYSDCDFSVEPYFHYNKGENHLDGREALWFARERKTFASGDRQRGKNQMAVIKGVINKAMSPAILKNYTQLLESVSGCFETSMPYDKIAELVRNQLEEGGSWNVVSCSVDGTGATKRPYSMGSKAYVMIPDQETVDAAIEKIRQVYAGEILE